MGMAVQGCLALGSLKGEANGGGDGLLSLNANKQLDFLATVVNGDDNAYDDPDNNPYLDIKLDSKFYDEESFMLKNKGRPLFINLNIQSLQSKFDKLKRFILSLTSKGIQVDVIALQETWNIRYPHLFTIPGFQKLIFINRNKGRGGGVGFYIRTGINYKIVEDRVGWLDKIFESLTLTLTYTCNTASKNMTISNIYRSPTPIPGLTNTQQHEQFNNKLEAQLHLLSTLKHDSYIFLDSNINVLKLTNDESTRLYLNTIHDKGFLLTNMKASRMTGTCSTLIDHILTNSKAQEIVSGSIICDISDHWVTFLQPNLTKSKTKPTLIKHRATNKTNLERFKTNLQNTNWDEVLTTNNVDECYSKFWALYSSLYDIHFPWVTTKFNRNVHSISNFMTPGLLISRRTKMTLLKRSLTDPSPANSLKYKQYRNTYNTVIRASKQLHINNKLKKDAKNPKKIWDTLKELTSGKQSTSTINSIKNSEGKTLTDPALMADEFNSFFTSAGKKVAESVEPISRSPESFLPDTNPPLLEFNTMSQGTLIHIISNMEAKSSTDINGLSTKLIKYLKYELATPLLHLFNLSIRDGQFPSKLKTSRTVPIFKVGDNSNCDNYRPISLLSAISKILEKFIANQLVDHLEYNKLLYENQYGFQKNKSTVHSLLKLTNYVAEGLNNKKYVAGVFLDLKKAFDVVPHDILLKKLSYLGIRGVQLDWFASYLSGRCQQVEIGGHLSSTKPIDISVLQGSILGPILFLCYINDLHTVTDLLTLLFADDTVGLDSDNDLKRLIDRVNIEINKIANWFRANKMAVNISKTKYIIFKPKGMNINLTENEGIVYDNNEIGLPHDNDKVTKLDRIYNDNPNIQDRTYKLLGLYLDEHLSFNYHCKHVSNKLAQSNFIINRVKNLLPQASLKTLYYAMIHPHLLYCLPIYACTTANNITMLEKMQKKAIRTITKSQYNAHTAPLFKALGILPLKHLIDYTQILLTHSIYHKYSPPALHNTWITNGTRLDNHTLRNADDLFIPLARTDQIKRLPLFALPRLWNDFYEQKFTPNPTTFKIAIKSYFKDLLDDHLNPLS